MTYKLQIKYNDKSNWQDIPDPSDLQSLLRRMATLCKGKASVRVISDNGDVVGECAK